MRLRNKKTGEIIEADSGYSDGLIALSYVKGNVYIDDSFSSLAELNADWEDYLPQEPLIENDEERKLIKTWAKRNGFDRLRFLSGTHIAFVGWSGDAKDNYGQSIEFRLGSLIGVEKLHHFKTYTITELCGEE